VIFLDHCRSMGTCTQSMCSANYHDGTTSNQ